jgi:hypothetical protein
MSFASTTRKAATSQGNNSTANMNSGALASSNVLAGDLIEVFCGTRSTTPPVKISGSPTINGVTVEGLTKLGQFEADEESVELWVCRATANATANVSATGTLTGTATRREGGIRIFGSVPASWELVGVVSNHQATATSAHACGSLSAAAGELRLTASSLANSHSGVTAATGFTADVVSAACCSQHRIETEGGAKNPAWTSVTARTSINMQVALREPGAGGNRRRRFFMTAG